MNAAITTPRRTTNSVEPATLVVIVVAPRGRLADCDLAIAGAASRGAHTFSCEVPANSDGELRESDFAFGIAIDSIASAVDRAVSEVPGLPIVLVGHAEAGMPVRVYADLCPDQVAGVVLTEKSGHLTAA